jgi:hypothetical protein
MGENFLGRFFNKSKTNNELLSPERLIDEYRTIKTSATSEKNANNGKLSSRTKEELLNSEQNIINATSNPIKRDVLSFLSKHEFDLELFIVPENQENWDNPIKYNTKKLISLLNRGFADMGLPKLGQETLFWAIDIAKQNKSNELADVFNKMSLSIIEKQQFYDKSLKEVGMDRLNPRLITGTVIFMLIAREFSDTPSLLIDIATKNEENYNWVKNIIEQSSQL